MVLVVLKKKVVVGNGVTLVEVDKDDVDGASAPILGGVVPLCTLKEWSITFMTRYDGLCF